MAATEILQFYVAVMVCQPVSSMRDVNCDPSGVAPLDNNCSLSVVSCNMHDFNQGSHTVRDLIIEFSCYRSTGWLV